MQLAVVEWSLNGIEGGEDMSGDAQALA